MKSILYIVSFCSLYLLLISKASAQNCELLCNESFDDLDVTPGNNSVLVNFVVFPCWRTSSPDSILDIWPTGFLGVPSYSGNQFMELNGTTPSTLSQTFNASSGMDVRISFAHRGRLGVDTLGVLIGPVGGPFTTLGYYADDRFAWNYYSINYTIPTGIGNNHVVMFRAVSSAFNSPTEGNFLDAVSLVSTPSFIINTTPATCLDDDGSVTITSSGGSGNYLYHWTPLYDTTSNFIGNAVAGGYSAIVIDLATGCSDTLSAIVSSASGINATIVNSVNATCDNADDGSAAILVSGGQPPYFYLWPNGDTTATSNHLSPGTYLIRVEDYNGCPSYVSLTIRFNFASPVIELGPDTMPCTGTPFILNAGPGFSSYLWSNNSTNQTLTVTNSGSYTVVVSNSNGCENSDDINVTFFTCVSTGIYVQSNLFSSLNIYPNPFDDEFNIELDPIMGSDLSIWIWDLLGNKLFSENEYACTSYYREIRMQSSPSGIYIITLEINGEKILKRIAKR